MLAKNPLFGPVTAGLVLACLVTLGCATVSAETSKRLFPKDLPQSEWKRFDAAGYSSPVSGVIYKTGQKLSFRK